MAEPRVSPDRAIWEWELGFITHYFREGRAQHHDAKAKEAADVPCDCVPLRDQGEHVIAFVSPDGEDRTRRIGGELYCEHQSRVRWHEGRAAGQRERFSRIGRCEETTIEIRCGACSRHMQTDHSACEQHRVCVHCRGRRARRYRQRFAAGRRAALADNARAMRGDAPGTAGGRRRFREVFLTLTIPASGDPALDVAAIAESVPRFVRRLRGALASVFGLAKETIAAIPLVRALEITPGNEGGHAHVHVWAILPFVHHVLLRRLWADSMPADRRERLPHRDAAELLDIGVERALEREAAGTLSADHCAILRALRRRKDSRTLAPSVPWPVIDVRAVHGDPSNELVKYMLKDLCGGELVDPDTFAKLYESLEGRRTIIATVDFWRDPPLCTCPSCGAIGSARRDRIPTKLERLARAGPPRPTSSAAV